MEHIKSILKKLRSESNKSQSEIAEMMGISQSAYSRLENDPGNATFAQISRLAEIYDADIALLLEFDDDQLEYYDYYIEIKKIVEQ